MTDAPVAGRRPDEDVRADESPLLAAASRSVVHASSAAATQVGGLRAASTPSLEHPQSAAAPQGGVAPPWRDAVFRRLLALADVAAAAGGVAVIGSLSSQRVAIASLATLPLIVLIAKTTGRYDHDEVVLRKSTLDEVPALLTLAAAYVLVWSFAQVVANAHVRLGAGGVVELWASTAILLIALRATARAFGQLSAPIERVLVVGNSTERARLTRSLASDPGARIEVVGGLPLEDERHEESDWDEPSRRVHELRFADLGRVVRELDVHRVFLIPSHVDAETMLDAVRRTTAVGVKVSIVPRLLEVVGSAVEFDVVGGVTVLGVRRAGLSRSSSIVKRAMDVVGAVVGLIVLAPFAVLIAIAIKLDSPGPLLFRQRRVGRDGKPFEMFKFRSMIEGAEAKRAGLEALNESDGIFKLSTDPRVTRLGRLLRASSIDELPQLINVLRGEMSLVGPRPLVVPEDRLVEGWHRERLTLAPGMTGPWQVLGPARPPLSEMVKTDYLYAANWSLWSDVKILLRTFAHVVGRRGL